MGCAVLRDQLAWQNGSGNTGKSGSGLMLANEEVGLTGRHGTGTVSGHTATSAWPMQRCMHHDGTSDHMSGRTG